MPTPIGVPQQIGPYQVQRLLGSGGMATVYAALQKQPRRTVALKVMKAGIAQSRGEAALRRFKREIEILGQLHHPYIAAVYDAGTFDDGSGPAPYFVMEYIPGATNILEYISKKEMNVRDRLKLFVKVCAAVEHGHGHKVIHRDLKPGNILIDQYGEPKIIDFGIAHAAETDISQQTMATESGNLVGTLQYMAPEQVDTRPQDLDGRCDVYALGVLLYKMTTGKPPYDLEALPVFEAIRIIREENPRRPSEINPEVKGDLETVILKAMERERDRRYRNAGSLGRDIIRFLANKPINARRASWAYRASLFAKRNAAVLSVIGVIALVAAVALGYTTWERMRIKRQQSQSAGAIRAKEQDLARQRAELEIARSAAARDNTTTAAPASFTLEQHTSRIAQLRFAAAGGDGPPLLVSCSADHTLIAWDLASQAMRQRLTDFDGAIDHLALSADGSLIATASSSEDGRVRIARLGGEDRTRSIADEGEVTCLAISPDGRRLAWGSKGLALHVEGIDPQTLESQRGLNEVLLRSSSGAFTAAAFAPTIDVLAAATHRGTINILTGRDAGAVQRLSGLKSAVLAISLVESASGLRLAAVAEDGGGMVWTRSEGGSWSGAPFVASDKPVIAASFSPNGSHLAVATADGVQIWEMRDDAGAAPRRAGAIIKGDDTPTAIAIDDRGLWLALGMLNGDVRLQFAAK